MLWVYLSLSLSLFPLSAWGRVLSATSSPPHLIVFSTLPCLLSSSSSLPPLLPSSHLSEHSPPISALASLVCHQPYFLRVLPTIVCSSPVSLSSSSTLLSALATLAIFRTQLFSHTCSLVVVVRSLPRFPFRTGMLMSHRTSARDLALQSFWDPPVRHHPLNCSPRVRSGLCSPT